MIKKLWNDPVWSKVIAGVILAAGATIVTYLLNWWPIIGQATRSSYNYAFHTSNISNWLLGLIVILSIPTILFVIALFWGKIHPQKTKNGPDWQSYRSDIYFGLRWRWEYFDDGTIHNLYTFCPNCDFQIYPHNASAFRFIDRIGFHCDSCGKNLGELDDSSSSLENKVRRFIQQKIRTGSWERASDRG